MVGLPSLLLFRDPEPLDRSPNAFFILLAAVEVRDLCCIDGELESDDSDGDGEFDLSPPAEEELGMKVRGLPEEVRQAATKIS